MGCALQERRRVPEHLSQLTQLTSISVEMDGQREVYVTALFSLPRLRNVSIEIGDAKDVMEIFDSVASVCYR